MDTILDFGLAYDTVVRALPIAREIRKMPRAYICNVIHTVVGEVFSNWAKQQIEETSLAQGPENINAGTPTTHEED